MQFKSKQIRSFLIFFSCLVLALQLNIAFAQETAIPLPNQQNFGDIPGAPTLHGDSFLQQLATLIGGYRAGEGGIIGVARPIIGAIAILMIIISALRILFADGEEGAMTKGKNGIIYGLLGLALISVAGEIMKVLSVSDEGLKAAYVNDSQVCYLTILSDPNALQCRAKLFSRTVQIAITFVKYLLGSIAVLQIIISATKLIATGGAEEELGKEKKKLIWSSVGFGLIIFASTFVNKVFFKLNYNTYVGTDGVKPAVDAAAGVSEIVGFTNLLVSIVGPLAVLMLLIGAGMYLFNGGDESKIQQGRRIIVAALVGIIVIFGAFAVVSTVISGKFQ